MNWAKTWLSGTRVTKRNGCNHRSYFRYGVIPRSSGSRLARKFPWVRTTPRGVVLTHGNFLANLEPLERGITPYRKYERWLHPLRFVTLVPLSHVFAQFMTLFAPPLLGATAVF